jgi:hypothetical protein
MLELVAIRHQGDTWMFQLTDGTIVTRDFVIRQLDAGRTVMVRPLAPASPARLFAVRNGKTTFISTDPGEKQGDNLGQLPSF